MIKQDVLLIDLRSKQRSKKHLESRIPARFYARCVTDPQAIEESILTSKPRLLLFLYDYPQLEGLEALSGTKQSFPSIPILMITEQHSEDLVIWAYETGVRNYMYNPYTEQELEQRIALFSKFSRVDERRSERRRVKLSSPIALPTEARFNAPVQPGKQTTLALRYIAANIHKKITLEQVAGHCNMSGLVFSRTFKKEQGISFQEYLGRCRIRKAQQLLRDPDVSITEAGLSAGFTDLSHFSRKFNQVVGTSPSVWRKQSPSRLNLCHLR